MEEANREKERRIIRATERVRIQEHKKEQALRLEKEKKAKKEVKKLEQALPRDEKKKRQALRQEKEKKQQKEELAALLKKGQQQMEEIQAAFDLDPSVENKTLYDRQAARLVVLDSWAH